MRILIADDDLTSRSILSAVLQKNGYEVLAVADGAAALEALSKPDSPRLAILDWMMPEMDGIEVLRRLRSGGPDLQPYIIMLTSRGEKSDIVSGLQAGANDYLAKPFDSGELQARVAVGRRMVELEGKLQAMVEQLSQALEQVRTLRGIVPICANCKKIRDDAGYWQQVEVYVREHTEAEFSHGLCPECIRSLYPEMKT